VAVVRHRQERPDQDRLNSSLLFTSLLATLHIDFPGRAYNNV
jgi:hypothetical protein